MKMLRKQAGFTLMELMAASAAGGIVLLAANAFLLAAYAEYDALMGKIEMNRHARETINLLTFGGKSTTAGNDTTKYVYGIPGRSIAPTGTFRSNYAVQYTSNNLTLTPDKFGAMSVQCKAAANPLPDCTGTEIKSVTGWLGDDVILNTASRSVANRTLEVGVVVTDPFEAQRANSPVEFSESYRTILSLNRNELDP